MNRRDFFRNVAIMSGVALSGGGIALLDQELWKPTKSIFLPPKKGWIIPEFGYAIYEPGGQGALTYTRGGFSNAQAALYAARKTVAPAISVWRQNDGARKVFQIEERGIYNGKEWLYSEEIFNVSFPS